LILSAATATGKAEAAFLPIIALIADAPKVSIQALYVSPLVALINDKFHRLERLCEKSALPFTAITKSERLRMLRLLQKRIGKGTPTLPPFAPSQLG
jgi:Lhr-like helicase